MESDESESPSAQEYETDSMEEEADTDEENVIAQSKKISNDQELIQSDPISCPQNQKGNN